MGPLGGAAIACGNLEAVHPNRVAVCAAIAMLYCERGGAGRENLCGHIWVRRLRRELRRPLWVGFMDECESGARKFVFQDTRK